MAPCPRRSDQSRSRICWHSSQPSAATRVEPTPGPPNGLSLGQLPVPLLVVTSQMQGSSKSAMACGWFQGETIGTA
jgi:hypothetical protein